MLLAFLALSVSANDEIRQRGCRVGTPNPHISARRFPSLSNGVNPYIGDRRQLVILVSFQDKDFQDDQITTLQKWDKIFNAENYSEDNYIGSIHDYFMAQSYGKLNLSFDLLFFQLPDERTKYRSNSEDDENSQYMVDDIVDFLQTQDIDWEQYDWNDDTYVDQLLIVYAGEGMNASIDMNTIWPHQWWLSWHKNLETDDPEDYRSYRTITSGDKEYIIDCYCCVQESVKTGKTQSSFGTICHEYSHCFGFPDFYYGSYNVVREWDIMDHGNYNDYGFRPCNYSAHERMLMGWLTPIELTEPTVVTDMPALVDEPQAYIIRNDAEDNEYYIIENRQQLGWDEELPGCGIVVFHIDYDKALWEDVNDYVNNDEVWRYSIIPANNNYDMKENGDWTYPFFENDSLTNNSLPPASLLHANVDGQLLMSKPITHMSVDENGLASFVFMGDTATWIPGVQTSMSDAKKSMKFDLSGRRIQHPQKGLYLWNGKTGLWVK